MYYPLIIRLSGSGSDTDAAVIALHERMEVLGAYVTVNATITANATNYAEFKVLGNDQSTALFEHSTQDSAEGTLTADTPAELVDQKKAELAVFEAGDALIVQLGKGGSQAADACLVLNCRQARNY